MLRDGRAADRKLLGDRGHGHWAVAQELEDRAASRVAQGVELSVLVSRHLRKLELTDGDVKSVLQGALSVERDPNGY
jgi:trehalose utilization protein